MSGSEAAKNQLAAGALRVLLGGALWVNLHQLPPFDSPKYVLELRTLQVSTGYGPYWGMVKRACILGRVLADEIAIA